MSAGLPAARTQGSFYRSALRPLLFALPPDRAHALGHSALRHALPWRALSALQGLEVRDPALKVRFAGIDLANPVGLAAGFDKNVELVDALSHLGFGFLTVGSIMPEPRTGHPYPRLVRYPETGSLADAMGVPSRGLAWCVERLARASACPVPLIANIGGFTPGSIAAGFSAVEPHVRAVEISVMCPNMLEPGETFDYIGFLREILKRLDGRRKPAVVRIPNDVATSSDAMEEFVESCVDAGIEGLKVAGGRSISEPRLGIKRGTLHGPAVFETALDNVARAARFARGRIAIKGNGGVGDAEGAMAMLRAGAACVDLYSAFIYQGWTVARDINRALAPMLRGPVPAKPATDKAEVSRVQA